MRPDDVPFYLKAQLRSLLQEVHDLAEARGQLAVLPAALFLAATTAMDGNIDAVILQNALKLLDVGEARHIGEHKRLIGEQRGDHQRQSGILGARDGDFAP